MKRRFTNFSSFKFNVALFTVIFLNAISFNKSFAQCPVNPGDLANMTIMGNYTGNGIDSIQIQNLTNFDTMTVTGNSDITNDTLNLYICSGFAPVNGSTVTFWNSGTLTGEFSQVNILGTGSNLNNWIVRYNYPSPGLISAYYCGVSVTLSDLDGQELCVGTPFSFQAVRSPISTIVTAYNWSSTNPLGIFNPNNSNAAGTTDFTPGTASSADSIIVEMVTNAGCTVYDTIEVSINPDILVDIMVDDISADSAVMCENGSITIQAGLEGGNNTLSYSWTVYLNNFAAFGSNFLSDESGTETTPDTIETIFTIPNNITTIEEIDVVIEVTDATGCSSLDTIHVTVLPEPDVDVAGATSPVCSDTDDENVSLTLSNLNGFADGYYWEVDYNGLTGSYNSGDGCTTGTMLLDTVVNTTLAPVTVTYTIWAYQDLNSLNCGDGCLSTTPETVMITVNPEPTVADDVLTVCSDIATGYNLPDLGDNGLDIDSFTVISDVDGGLSGSATMGSGITSLTALEDDVFGNTTNAALDVVYSIIPFSDGCAGDTFTVTVTVNPEPVTNPSLATSDVCSDIESGILLSTNMTSVAAADWDIISIDVAMGLTAGGSNATIGDGQLANALENDVFTNSGALPLDVVYEVVPVSAAGCAGDTFTITLTINPEPVTNPALDSFEVCSDILANIVLSTNGTSVAADDWDIVSIDVAVGLIPDAGNALVGDDQTSTALEDDVFTNTTSGPLNVEYQVVPVSADGCAGDTFTIVVVVNPEPVTSPGLELAMVCSDVNSGIVLNTNGTSVSADVWDIISITPEVGLTAAGGNATVGDGQPDDVLEDDVFTNVTPNELEVIYVVVPVSADGCAGDTFNITLTVKPEPVVADQTATACSDTPIEVTLGDDVDGPSAATYDITSVNLNGLPAVSELAYSGNLTTGNQNFGDRLGMVFTTNAPVSVNQLGAFDSNQDGLNLPITVGIIRNSDQAVMAGPVTLSGIMQALGADGRHRMTNITPVILAPDTYTIVAVGYGATEPNGNSVNPPNITTTTNTGGGLITFNSSSYGGSGFGFPTTPYPTPDVFHAGTFRFESTSVGNGVLANAIFNDSYTNTTNAPVDVVYEVVPISADGCAGDTFTVTVTINPEPVTDPALATATSCSDDSISVVLNTNGTSVSADTWDLISVVVDMDLTANGGNQAVADDLDEYAISGDSYTNITNAPQDVVYTVVPVSADGCAGDTFEITVTIKPEAVVADTSFSVCSDEAIGYNLPTTGDNGLAIDSFSVSASINATMYSVSGILSGGAEVPPNGSPASGVINGVYNSSTNQLTLTVSYGGLTSNVVAAHIHGPAAPGVNAGVILGIVPTLVMPGSTTGSLTGTVTLPGVAEAPLLAGLTYINIHTIGFPGGEIRAQLSTTPIGGDLTGTPTEGTGLTGADLAADVYNNVTNMPDTVWYTITPYSMGCAGDPYTLAVGVNPEPVVADSTFTVCSDEAIGYDLPAVGDNGLGIDSFSVSAFVGPGLTGMATEGTGLTGSAIAADDYNNITATPDSVIYTITPYTAGCAGDSYDLTVRINPEPVVADSSFSICSDVAIGYNLPDAGDNGLDIDSFGITAMVDMDLSGTPTEGTVTSLTAIAGDIYNNVTMAPHMVVYTITPYTNGCAGDMYNLTVTVNPEPVGEDSTITVCSDETFTYDPQGSIINQAPAMMIIDTIFYTGAMQTFTVPAGVTSLNIKAFGGSGAAGSQPASGSGGLGGQAEGDLAVSSGQMLNVYVGGQASGQTGGFNGGGSGGSITGPNQNSAVGVGGGGGGASDVRFGGMSLADRILVAGGGGGGGVAGCEATWMGGNGGEGGGGAGANGVNSPDGGGGFGGTVGIDGAAGIGCPPFSGTSGIAGDGGNGQGCCCFAPGSSTIPAGGGGGGGYVQGGGGGGGSAGTAGCSGNNKGGGGGGAGGSSYTGGVSGGLATNNINNGNGYVVVSYTIPAMTSTFDWEITDIVGTVTGAIEGDTGSGIITDAINNVSNTPATVTYSIVPTSVPDGCVGDTFTFIVTVNPEPVVADSLFTVCSNDEIGYNLPAAGDNALAIDSFSIVVSVPMGITPAGGNAVLPASGITDLTFIASDAYNNVTPNPDTVVYTITPYSMGCAGDAYEVAVEINAEPVVNNQTLTVCSDAPLGINLNADNDGSPLIQHYNIVNIDSTSLTSSAGSPVVADSVAVTEISDDAWTNTTGSNQFVTYFVVPVSVDGCLGDTFTVTVTVRPEPVVSITPFEECSDVAFGTQSQLPQTVGGVSIGNYRFVTLNTNGLTSSAGADPADDTNAPGQYPFYVPTTFPNTNQISNANRNRINNDAWTNLTQSNVDVIYTLIPYSEDFGCPGDTFTVTATINPEPVGVGPTTPEPICSGSPFEIDLNDYITNDGVYLADDDDVEDVSFSWTISSVLNGVNNAPISNFIWPSFLIGAVPVPNFLGQPGAPITGDLINGSITNGFAFDVIINYTVTPTSGLGCEGSPFVVPVRVYNNPDVSLSPNGDNTLCEGESRTLQGSVVPNISPASYIFEYSITAGTGTLANANTISATVTATSGPLTVQFKATNPTSGCSDSISFTFTVNPNPTFTIVSDTIYGCAVVPNGAQGIFFLPNGASAASGTLTFHVSESDANAGIGAIGNTTNYTGNDNQEIWVRLTGVNGCYTVASFILSVSPLPNAAIAGTLTYCDGDSTILTASGGDFYLWNDINNTNTNTLTVTEPGTYTVTVTNDIGCSATASVTVTEHPKPTASITASETAVCYGESITLTANGGEVVEWSTGETDNPIIFLPEVGDSTITVVVENVFGCLDTASIILTGYPIPDPILVNNLDTCALTFGGSTAEFDLALSSDSTLNFHLTESDAQNGIGSIVNPNTFTGTNGQLIWWSYVDVNGCIAIGSFELKVNPLPTVLASADESAICLGEDVTLDASAPMGSLYLWSPDGQTTQMFVDTPAVTTTYTVVVTDLNGCINSSEVTVTVNPNPAGTITGTDGVECEGSTVTLVAGGGDAYEWLNGVGNTSSVDVTITSDTTFTVVVTNAFGCTDTTSVDIELSPELLWDSTNVVNVTCNGGSDGEVYALATGGTAPLTYAWEDGDANSIGSSSSVTGLEAGSYHLTVTDDEGCSITISLQVTEPDALQIVAVVSNNLECNGDSTGNVSGTILGGEGPYTIYIEGSSSLDSLDDPNAFYFENLAADTYIITAVDTNGCEVSINVEITEPTPLLISATPTDAECNGGNGTITVFGSGGTPGYSYFVNFPAPNTPANSPSFNVPAGTYTVYIEDTNSCRDSVEVTIGEPTAVVVDSIVATNESCDGANDGTATAYVSGGTPGYTYSWSNAQSTSIATGLGEGTYYVTITDINGCEVIDSVEIGVNAPAPPVVLNCPVDITLYVQDCDISYSWLAPTIVDNCLTTQLTVDLDGAENEGFTLGIQQVNFEPGVYDITYTDETADPDTIACAFTVTVIDSVAPVIVCPDTVEVQCVEDIPAYYTNYLNFIADGGILDDNCTVNLSTFAWVSDSGLLTPECTNRDTITRIYSVEDIYGNTGLCEQTIVVYDTIAPTITLPSDTLVDCNAMMTPVQLGSATAEDNCETGSVTITWADSSTQSGDVDSCDNYNYVITRTWYAEDECGNIDSLDQIIMVQDTTKPDAVCQDFFVYLDINGEASILPDSINNGSTDNCMPSASLNLALDVQDFDCDDVPSVEVTLFVKDACGNTNSCTAIVTVADTVPPVAICQTAITIYLDNLGNVSIDSTDIDNGSSDNCAIKNMILSDSEFDCDDVATSPNVVEMYVIDFYNNADTCSTNVTVLDTIKPVALCQDITVQLDNTGNVSITAGMINNGSEDACGIDTMTVSPNAFDCNDLNANTVVLTVTDVNGNTQTCSATVTVQDTLDPVAICADITVSLDSASGEYTLTSLDSTNIVSTSSDNCSFTTTIVPSTFDCDDVFAPVTVFVTLTDPSNNTDTCTALVTVNDVTDPTPDCADITVELDSLTGVYILNAADSTDIVNNTFDACGFTTEFSQDTFTCADALSPVVVTVTYTDPSNNTSTCVVDVTVEDNFAPAPQCSDYTVELDSASGQYILTALDSSEIVDGTFDACGFTADFSRDTFYCSDALAPVTITVTYEDPTGNTSTCTSVITVEDNFAPAAQCSDYTVELDSATGIYVLNAVDSSEIVDGTFDACGFTAEFSRDAFNCLDVFAPVTITVTYEDPTGNISTCTADITVNDVTAPTAVCNDITVSLDSTGNYTLTPTDIFDIGAGSFDACSYQYVLDTVSFTCSDVGTNNVTATFNDPSNNVSICVSVVTVTDTIAPVIVCQDTIINLDSLGEASLTANELVVSATDACGVDTMSITQTDFACIDLGPNTETITVTDVNGNSKTCTVVVTVVDTLAPWFTLCKADTTMNTSPTSCFAPYADIFFAPIEDNCTPSSAIIVTSTAKVISSGQIINMIVTPINAGVDGYKLSVPGLFGFSLPVGPNLLTVYATDGQGNIDSCQWTVQVNDVWAPSVQNCPANITVNVNPTTCMAQAFWGGPTASDNCSGVSLMTQNNNQYFSGAFFPGGTNNVTTVQYTATDNSGNTNTSCSFTVTVVGTCTPPMPDLSPEHITGGTNYNPGQTKSIVVRVRNLSANPTTAPVVFFVQKMNPNFTIGVNPTQTSATVGINTYTVSNSDWDIVEQPTRWRFTSKTGVVINGNTEKLVGISVTANNFPMSSANLTTNIVAGTGGGETPTNNNNKTNVLLIN